METAEISYRVADFLKKHPPFNAIDDADLLALSARGRVRFHEPYEYILWQGEPHRHQVFVIQQGTVSLWDDTGGPRLLDVRGAGDLLGVERYHDAPRCAHSARSESDVVIYSFPEEDFSQFVLKYPHAVQYVAAEGRVTLDYQGPQGRREPQRTFVQSLVGHRPLAICHAADTLAQVARQLSESRSDAIAVLDHDGRVRGVLTVMPLLAWIAAGGGDAHHQTIETIMAGAPTVVGPDTSVSDAVIAMDGSVVPAIAITADGTLQGRLQALVTPDNLAPFFGDQPAAILRDIRHSRALGELHTLTQRSRALTLEYLTSAGSVEWLTKLTHLVDAAIVTRVLALAGVDGPQDCWCFCGTSGRQESLARVSPHLVVVLGDESRPADAHADYRRVREALAECGYLPDEQSFDAEFYVAPVAEWRTRYRDWVRDPVMHQMYRARTLFDVRPMLGPSSLWAAVADAIADAVDRDFLHVLANDCRASLPPLTFYQDAVIDSVGDHESTFRLEESALRPLVDVGRVFGMAGGAGLGRSTLERFATARALLPEHEAIFREAADMFRVVLWQQGRVGISQGTSGAELPPTLLSRHDRHTLKSGFRSIRRLLEFTADPQWLTSL